MQTESISTATRVFLCFRAALIRAVPLGDGQLRLLAVARPTMLGWTQCHTANQNTECSVARVKRPLRLFAGFALNRFAKLIRGQRSCARAVLSWHANGLLRLAQNGNLWRHWGQTDSQSWSRNRQKNGPGRLLSAALRTSRARVLSATPPLKFALTSLCRWTSCTNWRGYAKPVWRFLRLLQASKGRVWFPEHSPVLLPIPKYMLIPRHEHSAKLLRVSQSLAHNHLACVQFGCCSWSRTESSLQRGESYLSIDVPNKRAKLPAPTTTP